MDDKAPEIAIVTDSELKIRFAGGTRESLIRTGASLDTELTGECLLDQIEDVSREEAGRICEAILAGERFAGGSHCWRMELPVTGRRVGRWVVILGPHTDRSGRVDGVVYARLRTDDAGAVGRYAVAPDTLYEVLVDNASEFVALLDPQGVITFMNHRMAVISGFPASRFIGKHFTEVVHPDDIGKCREMIEYVVNGGAPYTDFAFRVVAPDGAVYHLVANGSLVRTSDGPRVLGVCRDVTESVALGEQLAARNKALSALNEIVVALSSSGSVEQGLQVAMEKILATVGFSMGGILLRGKDGSLSVRASAGVDVTWYEAKREAIADTVNRYRDTLLGPVYVPDLQMFGESDEEILQLIPEGDVKGAVVVPLTCGAEMAAVLVLVLPPPAELSLEQMEFVSLAAAILGPAVENAQLIEAGRLKSLQLEALAKEARHRVKNNLQMVAGLLSMCSKESDGDSRAVGRCLRQIGAISAVNDLLNPANAGEGVRIKECLVGIANSAVAAVGMGDEVQLSFGGEDCELPADVATALGIIVNELVTNALTHGFREPGGGRIDVNVSRDGGRAVVEVRDHGAGLPDGFDLSRDRESTSGLGIVRSLATYGLGGTLELTHADGGGTCARIAF